MNVGEGEEDGFWNFDVGIWIEFRRRRVWFGDRCFFLKMMSCLGFCGKKLGLYFGENGKLLKVFELREDKLRFEDYWGKLRKRVYWREAGLEIGN